MIDVHAKRTRNVHIPLRHNLVEFVREGKMKRTACENVTKDSRPAGQKVFASDQVLEGVVLSY